MRNTICRLIMKSKINMFMAPAGVLSSFLCASHKCCSHSILSIKTLRLV